MVFVVELAGPVNQTPRVERGSARHALPKV